MEHKMRPWEANIRRVIPYVPGEQPQSSRLIKLNTNENPYPPAPGVQKAMREMDYDAFRKYPDPAASVLVESLADYYGLGTDQVFVGVGSDDVIAMAFMTFFNSEKPILFPDISYSFYKVWAGLFRIPFEMAVLDDGFRLKKEDYYKENGGVIFPNPNAPTGLLLQSGEVEEIIRHNQDVIVIVDEAYIDFGGTSVLELIHKYENLLVVQTFSKSRSMAGMRIGFAAGHPDLIRALNNVKYSYNSYTMNLPALILGSEAVKDDAYFKKTLKRITDTREHAKARLKAMGFSFPDSMTNFIFAAHERMPARQIYEALKEAQIYVRYFPQPGIDNYLRISIGTDEEMAELFHFLGTYL